MIFPQKEDSRSKAQNGLWALNKFETFSEKQKNRKKGKEKVKKSSDNNLFFKIKKAKES